MSADASETMSRPDSATGDEPPHAATYATQENLEKINSDLRAQLGRMNKSIIDLSGAMSEKRNSENVTDPPDTGNVTDPPDPRIKQLTDDVKAMKDRESAIKQGALRSCIHQALVDAGADGDLAKLAIPEIVNKYGNFMSVVQDDLNGYRVDPADGGMDASGVVGLFLGTPTGKKLIASKRNPTVETMPDGSPIPDGGVVYMTPKEMATADPKLLQSGKVRIKA